MRKILSVVLFLALSICLYSQTIDEIITEFSTEEYSKIKSMDEKEWKYARYILSKIELSFYKLDKDVQLNDTISGPWFDKVFTRGNGNNYSLDFDKVGEETTKINIENIPDVKEFNFIGMKIPLLEKTQSIIHLELENCTAETKSKFREQIQQIKALYEVLTDLKSSDDKLLMMRNKEPNSFTELIIVELGETPYLMKMKGAFDISDISAPKDYE